MQGDGSTEPVSPHADQVGSVRLQLERSAASVAYLSGTTWRAPGQRYSRHPARKKKLN